MRAHDRVCLMPALLACGDDHHHAGGTMTFSVLLLFVLSRDLPGAGPWHCQASHSRDAVEQEQ